MWKQCSTLGRAELNLKLPEPVRNYGIVMDRRAIKDLGREKQRLGISSFLRRPLDLREFFKCVARIRARHDDRQALRHSGREPQKA